MKFTLSVTLAIVAMVSSTAALQANWYYDNNCADYEDSTYFSGVNCQGNYQGAGSGLFVTQDGSCNIYGCENSDCTSCAQVRTGECVSFPDGVWFFTDC